MSDQPQSPEPASLVAEEILRTIYGDDLKGCTVTLESIATIIRNGIPQETPKELLMLYEKVVEAAHVLSAPPPADKVGSPEDLHALVIKRLDSIHAITTKTMDTVQFFKKQTGGQT